MGYGDREQKAVLRGEPPKLEDDELIVCAFYKRDENGYRMISYRKGQRRDDEIANFYTWTWCRDWRYNRRLPHDPDLDKGSWYGTQVQLTLKEVDSLRLFLDEMFTMNTGISPVKESPGLVLHKVD